MNHHEARNDEKYVYANRTKAKPIIDVSERYRRRSKPPEHVDRTEPRHSIATQTPNGIPITPNKEKLTQIKWNGNQPARARQRAADIFKKSLKLARPAGFEPATSCLEDRLTTPFQVE